MTHCLSSATTIHRLYEAWNEAEQATQRFGNEVDGDPAHPRYLEAEARSHAALLAFLGTPTSSLPGILLKLQVACQYDDSIADVNDPACRLIVPRALVAATRDLERVTARRLTPSRSRGDHET